MRSALFLRYLMVGLLSAAFTVVGAVLYLRYGAIMSPWCWLAIGLVALLLFCLWIAWRSADSYVQFITGINEELSQYSENINFSRLKGAHYREIAELQENIRKLCGKIIASRKKLLRQQDRFNFILEHMAEGIVIMDLSGRIVNINRKATAIFGLSEPPLRRDIRDVISDQSILDAVEKAIQRNKVSGFDLKTVSGSIYALTLRLIREGGVDSPKKALIVMNLSDVTAERSALQQRQDFFTNASHELKTPITSIQGFSELLESGIVTGEKAMDSIRIIHREATRMNQIISDLLMISALENQAAASSMKQDVPAMVNIGRLIGEIRESLAPQMQERNITMEISGGNFSIPIVASHMHNLFGNLMQNAVKYNVEGGKVWVRVETDGKYLYLTVKDTGIGIPAELKSRVFERFFRVDKGRSRSVGGTGLGLSIVKHIVTLYDGTIQLDSELGVGTTIQIKLKYLKKSDLSEA